MLQVKSSEEEFPPSHNIGQVAKQHLHSCGAVGDVDDHAAISEDLVLPRGLGLQSHLRTRLCRRSKRRDRRRGRPCKIVCCRDVAGG